MSIVAGERARARVITEVQVTERSLDLLAPYLSAERRNAMTIAAQTVRERLQNRTIFNINSTAQGGGVAELVQALCGYARGAGTDSRWLVIEGDPRFFQITKRIHNNLHNQAGDSQPLTRDDQAHYEQTLLENAEALTAHIRPGDIVILHDPQTAGLTPHMLEMGARVIWRSHIGHELRTPIVSSAWDFLRPYVEQTDLVVLTLPEYAPEWLDKSAFRVIYPSIDPASPKNDEITPETTRSILKAVGLLSGPAPDALPLFRREDGSLTPVRRPLDMITDGELPAPDDPLVVQVARWDSLKGMAGVMRGFAGLNHRPENAHLLLIGPAVSGVADDPEAAHVLVERVEQWRALPDDARKRIHLATVPMDDREENAAVINAVQRHATIIVQKSLAEGFGLTVTEAMWKGKPLVASAVGGIRQQIIDGESGILLPDASDVEACARAIRELLMDPERAAKMGAAARERARELFLPDRHLLQYAELVLGTMPEAA